MTTKQRADDGAGNDTGMVDDDLDPMAKVAADIAAADAAIRKARQDAAAARRAAGIAHRYQADTIVLWLTPAGHWHPVFGGKLTIPYPTVSSLYVLLDFLLDSFHSVGQEHHLGAAAVAEDPETGRARLAYRHIDPNPGQ